MYNVTKRNGDIVDFDIQRIARAIEKAFKATKREYNPNMIDFIALKVTSDFEEKVKNHLVSVEDIQDSVEHVLI
ncbi:MAG: ATP cone domain-containing protein, partial [Sphaerochaetaceae bacterium]